ncbi:hypothetical protein HNY73_011494 [Argiope bruennichi]|uniref:Uncharacterized protein n=1 Tax=Argiope bruennichi TaxID=94029 RepID=A0A8T0F6Z2_ARGBR|nr:hypothetical protein HNY73_011494 [Argiope bruennichi]
MYPCQLMQYLQLVKIGFFGKSKDLIGESTNFRLNTKKQDYRSRSRPLNRSSSRPRDSSGIDSFQLPRSQSYTDPHAVLRRSKEVFIILVNEKKESVSIDQVKPAFCLDDDNDVSSVPQVSKPEQDKTEIKREIGEVRGEVRTKTEAVHERINNLEKRLRELEDRPNNFLPSPEYSYTRPTVKPLTFEGQTSWTAFKTQFDVVSSTNGWTDVVKASQLVASLRGSAAEVLQRIPSEKLTDLMTTEKALESRFGDSHQTQFYRTELKTRRQKAGESLQVLAADVERLMSLAYAECPRDVRENLAVKSPRHVRPIEIQNDTGRKSDDKFESLCNMLEKLLNNRDGEKNIPRRNPNGVPEVSAQFRYAVTDFPSQVSEKGVLVAVSQVSLKTEAIPVRVLNLNNKPKIVNKGTVIASCDPVVDIVALPQEFSGAHSPTILENLEELDEQQ